MPGRASPPAVVAFYAGKTPGRPAPPPGPPVYPWPGDPGQGYIPVGYKHAPGYPGSLTDGSSLTIASNTTYSFYSFPGLSVGSSGSPVSNVTFTGCRIYGTGTSAGLGLLYGDNITFSYCSFEPTSAVPPVAYTQGYQYGIEADGAFNTSCQQLTVKYCDLWGFGNAIDVSGSTQAKPQVFDHCWVHDARADGGVDHTDGIGQLSSSGASSKYVVVNACNIQSAGANTNALAWQRNGTFDNMQVTGNLLSGFNNTVSIDPGTGTAKNCVFTGNTFTTAQLPGSSPLYPSSVTWWTGQGGSWRNNRWWVPPGAAWGNPAHNNYFWMPVASNISGTDDTPFVSTTDYTG